MPGKTRQIQSVQLPELFTQESFKILGGSVPYDSSQKTEFVFPNKDNAYIELPDNWQNSFSDVDEIEYTAMYAKSKQVNLMLPAGLNVVDAKADKSRKILNGDMVSLSFNGTEISNLPSK